MYKYLCLQQSGQSKPDIHMGDILYSAFCMKAQGEASDSREHSCTIGHEPLSLQCFPEQSCTRLALSLSAWQHQLPCSTSRTYTGSKCSIAEEISKCYLFHFVLCTLTQADNTGLKQTALKRAEVEWCISYVSVWVIIKLNVLKWGGIKTERMMQGEC